MKNKKRGMLCVAKLIKYDNAEVLWTSRSTDDGSIDDQESHVQNIH